MSKHNDDFAVLWFWGVGVCLGLFFGCGISHDITKNGERANAINAGVARYEVDEKTGKTNFVYGVK